jgi:uncharacterized protein YlaI
MPGDHRMALLQERARVVRDVSRRLRQSRLVVSCAWCGRVSDGDDRWTRLESLSLRPRTMTHSICPECRRSLDGAASATAA